MNNRRSIVRLINNISILHFPLSLLFLIYYGINSHIIQSENKDTGLNRCLEIIPIFLHLRHG